MEKYSILNVALNQYFLFILKTSRFKGLHYFSLNSNRRIQIIFQTIYS